MANFTIDIIKEDPVLKINLNESNKKAFYFATYCNSYMFIFSV